MSEAEDRTSRQGRAATLSHPDLHDPEVLKHIAERLKQDYGAEKVIVYGSLARGEATIHSDIDLLVVAPSQDRHYWRVARVHHLIRDLSRGLPLSPIVLTPDEIEERIRLGDPFVRRILEEGIPL